MIYCMLRLKTTLEWIIGRMGSEKFYITYNINTFEGNTYKFMLLFYLAV